MSTLESTCLPTGVAPPNTHLKLPRLPAAITGIINRCSDAASDRWLGIATRGNQAITHPDAQPYEPVPYHVIHRILRRLALGRSAVFADIGSGKGRAVCTAARVPLRGVIGIEIDPALHALAESNVRRLRGRRTDIQLRCESATSFDFAGVTDIFFYNPFGEDTMRTVLANLRRSWEQQPRRIQIAYCNAVCGHQFARERWLELFDCWQMTPWGRLRSPLQFYRSRAVSEIPPRAHV